MTLALTSVPAQAQQKPKVLHARVGRINSQATVRPRVHLFNGQTRRFKAGRKLAWIALSRLPSLPAESRTVIKAMLRDKAMADLDGHVSRRANGALSMSLSSYLPLTRYGTGLRCRIELAGADKARRRPGHLTYVVNETRAVGVADSLSIRGRQERERVETRVRLTDLGKGRGYLVREATVTQRHANLDPTSPKTTSGSLSYYHSTANGTLRRLTAPKGVKMIRSFDGLSSGGELSTNEAKLVRSLSGTR